METADYVDYPTAVALKECGFNEPCLGSYCKRDSRIKIAAYARNWNGMFDNTYSVPSLYEAQKWLREKGLEVYAIIARDATYEWGIYHIPTHDNIACNMGPNYETYEAALSAGIEAAIKLIKKGEV